MPDKDDVKDYTDSMFGKTGYYTDSKRVRKALETAHDIRKFEIELYWKRALYFWGFQAAIFTAFAVLLPDKKDTDNINYVLPLMVATLGIIIAVCWYYIAEGSKAWQENWEEHIDLLETNITGNLYKTVLRTDDKFYSVSRINQFVIKVIAWFWILIIIYIFCIVLLDTVLCLMGLESYTIYVKEYIHRTIFLSLIGFAIIMLPPWRWSGIRLWRWIWRGLQKRPRRRPWRWLWMRLWMWRWRKERDKYKTKFGTAKDINIIKLNERSFRKKVKKIN